MYYYWAYYYYKNCCSTEIERTHRCCHLPIKLENIDRTPDIPYASQWEGTCSLKLPFYSRDQDLPLTWFLGPN